MNLWLRRYSSKSDTTLGLLYVDSEFFCYTLEDEKREVKVAGETRIPTGYYEVKKRKVDSGLTMKYRAKYDFFDYHLEIQDVPGFKYVYIHVGNDDDHTDGCILVGDHTVNNNITEHNNLLSSGPAFKRLYTLISERLDSGEQVMIKINEA